MDKRLSALWIILCFATSPSHAHAAPQKAKPTVTFSAMEFTGAVQQNHKGAFDYFVQDLSKRLDIEFDYHVMSPARGAKAFFDKQKQCLIPSSIYPHYFKDHDVIHTASFAKVLYLAFTIPPNEVITDKDQITGKVVGVIRDENTWDYAERFKIEGATYVKVGSLASLVEMLYRGRIDIAIHDFSDFTEYVDFVKKPPPLYSEQHPMAIDDVVITCHDTAENRAFMTKLDAEVREIIKEGLGPYFKKASIE